jgi:signal transduction histidine kinase
MSAEPLASIEEPLRVVSSRVMASHGRAALDSGMPWREPLRQNDSLADRVGYAYERTLKDKLAAAASAAALLAQQVGDAQAEHDESIEEAVERAEQMLGDFVEFVQIEMRGGIQVARRHLDLRLLCERVLDALQRRNPGLAVELARGSRIEGRWDPARIEMLLSKLVLNAHEHGVEDRVARVRLEGSPDQAVIEVWNAAPVLDDVLMRRLFEPFVCGPSARSHGSKGLGLGLYLSRAIARAHGGRIEVGSDKHSGTTFRATLSRE